MSDETGAERVSRFREHTNTNSSIRAPPDALWKDVGTEDLLDKFSDENDTTPAVRRANHPRRIMEPTGARKSPSMAAHKSPSTAAHKSPSTAAARKGSDAAATAATGEGTFGRFSRAFANVFGGVLGKRKAGHDAVEEPTVDAAQAALDERKRAAEEAYRVAKAQGLLPAPKVFVRPGMAPRAWSADSPARDPDPSRARPPLTPRTPGSVARSPSKRDLHRQRKLSKRVSSLEVKLASAKKELQSVLGNECFPAVPPLPAHLSASPTPHLSTAAAPLSPASASLPGNMAKKRKTAARDDEHLPTDTDASEPEHGEPSARPDSLPARPRTVKRVQSDAGKRLKRTSSRLHRKASRSSVRPDSDDDVVVVKPGGPVPPVPLVPSGVEGNKVRVVGDDGYGGLGHEMF